MLEVQIWRLWKPSCWRHDLEHQFCPAQLSKTCWLRFRCFEEIGPALLPGEPRKGLHCGTGSIFVHFVSTMCCPTLNQRRGHHPKLITIAQELCLAGLWGLFVSMCNRLVIMLFTGFYRAKLLFFLANTRAPPWRLKAGFSSPPVSMYSTEGRNPRPSSWNHSAFFDMHTSEIIQEESTLFL